MPSRKASLGKPCPASGFDVWAATSMVEMMSSPELVTYAVAWHVVVCAPTVAVVANGASAATANAANATDAAFPRLIFRTTSGVGRGMVTGIRVSHKRLADVCGGDTRRMLTVLLIVVLLLLLFGGGG